MNSKLRSKSKIEKTEGKRIMRKMRLEINQDFKNKERNVDYENYRILSRFSYHRARKTRDYNLQYKKEHC